MHYSITDFVSEEEYARAKHDAFNILGLRSAKDIADQVAAISVNVGRLLNDWAPLDQRMNLTDFLILYTPLSYAVFLVVLYFLSYLRDPLRFVHPHRESGEKMWLDVLLRLNLITEGEHRKAVQSRPRKLPKGHALGLSLAVVSPISGWILSLFYPTIIAAAFSLLFQFLLALVVLFLVIIPNLGSTAHIWKKHMSHIGSPKKRLGSRVLHLVELKKQVSHAAVVATDQTGLTQLATETQLGPGESRKEISGPSTPAALLPPAVKEEKEKEVVSGS